MSTEEPASLIRALHDVSGLVGVDAREADRRSSLSERVTSRLVWDRLFRLWIPRRYDGLELGLCDALSIYHAAARIDGSLGWAVMIGAGGGLFAAFLEPEAAREIFGPADAVIAGSGAPEGRAERVPGGYRARGRWRYASGAPYATTFTANCIVTSGGEPVRDADGEPLVRAMAFPRSDVEIVETWDAAGMRATASHDFVVEDAFVPEARSFSVFTDPPKEPGPLYRLPFQVLTELPLTAVALGIARHALDEFADLAAVKRPYGARGVLAEDAAAGAVFARAHAEWRLAHSGMFRLAERAWAAAAEGREPTAAARAEITAVCAHAVASVRRATAELVAMAGMTGIDRGAALARASLDLATLAAHFSVSPRQLADAGRALLGASRTDPDRGPEE